MDDQNPTPDTTTEAPAPAETPPSAAAALAPALVRHVAPPPPTWDSKPIYRVVEVMRDANGRLRKEGRVWHTDLERIRRFGRAVASNTASHKVQIADAMGDVMEELSPPASEARQARWGSWESIPLPPCPPKVRRKPRVTAAPAPALPSAPSPFGGLDVDALRQTLAAADAPAAEMGDDAPAEVGDTAPGADDSNADVLLP